jgi:hypothetical protein
MSDLRGSLTPVESGLHVPFNIKRVYYLYDVPLGAYRAGHAHKTLKQVLIALSGSFDVAITDGWTERSVHLNRRQQGLYIPPFIWRNICNFSFGAVCLVLASDCYDEADYVHAYDSFIVATRRLD